MTPPGLITTPFTASSTAEEALRGIDLNGVHAIVTGASIRPRVARLDLADRSSVTGFVESWDGPLHASTGPP